MSQMDSQRSYSVDDEFEPSGVPISRKHRVPPRQRSVRQTNPVRAVPADYQSEKVRVVSYQSEKIQAVPVERYQSEKMQVVSYQSEKMQAISYQSEKMQAMPVERYQTDAQDVQSLTFALHKTLSTQTGRTPVLVPGDPKRKREALYRKTSPLEYEKKRSLNVTFRHFMVGLAAVVVIVASLFFVSQRTNRATLPLEGAVNWSAADQQSLQIAIARANSQKPVVSQKAVQATVTSSTVTQAINNLNLPTSQYIAIAEADATKYGISPYYFVRQINQESGFNPNAVSPAGAVGIAQFIPSTAAGLGVDPYDPISALDGAARFMASLSSEFSGNYAMALAAYNAGPGAVQAAINSAGSAWLSVLPAETQNYVNIIMG